MGIDDLVDACKELVFDAANLLGDDTTTNKPVWVAYDLEQVRDAHHTLLACLPEE